MTDFFRRLATRWVVVVIIPVFAVYLLYDMNRIREGTKELVPHRHRPYVYARLGQVDRLLSAFARGQITVALILGSFYAIALTFCGVPMGLLVGFVIGLFNLVPVCGEVSMLRVLLMAAVLGVPGAPEPEGEAAATGFPPMSRVVPLRLRAPVA